MSMERNVLEKLMKLSQDGEAELERVEKKEKLDSEKLPAFVWIPEFISLAGSVMYGKKEPRDIDIVVRARVNREKNTFELTLDPSLKLKIDRILERYFGSKSKEWIASSFGPNWRYKPLFDLALIPHKPDEVREVNEEEFARQFYKLERERPRKTAEFQILKIDKKEHIVGGVVYEPLALDAQGDYTTAQEIREAMFRFMEKYAQNPRRIKVMHKGKSYFFPVLECFQPEVDTMKGGKLVPAGSWWLMIRVRDKEIWQLIGEGKLTGFSMAGSARARE